MSHALEKTRAASAKHVGSLYSQHLDLRQDQQTGRCCITAIGALGRADLASGASWDDALRRLLACPREVLEDKILAVTNHADIIDQLVNQLDG